MLACCLICFVGTLDHCVSRPLQCVCHHLADCHVVTAFIFVIWLIVPIVSPTILALLMLPPQCPAAAVWQ